MCPLPPSCTFCPSLPGFAKDCAGVRVKSGFLCCWWCQNGISKAVCCPSAGVFGRQGYKLLDVQLDSSRNSLNSLSFPGSCPWSSNSALHTPHTPSRPCSCSSELPWDFKWNIDFPALGCAYRNMENAHNSSKLSCFSCQSGVCLFFSGV